MLGFSLRLDLTLIWMYMANEMTWTVLHLCGFLKYDPILSSDRWKVIPWLCWIFSRMTCASIHVLLLTSRPYLPYDWTRPLPLSIWNARHAFPLMLTLHITMILYLHESVTIKSVRCACKHDVCCADLPHPLHISRRSFWTLRGTWNYFVNLWILPNMGHMAALRRAKGYVCKWAPNPALAVPPEPSFRTSPFIENRKRKVLKVASSF